MKLPNLEEKSFLLTEKLLNQLGLKSEERIILWLILDKLEIDTCKSEHNSLILGDVYDIGLNFMNIINRKVENWKIVNDLLRVQRLGEHMQEDPLIYECPIQL